MRFFDSVRAVATSVTAVGAAAALALTGVGAPSHTRHPLVVHSTVVPGAGVQLPAGQASAASASGVVSVATTPSGNGWWDVTPAGDVYTFGDAGFHGSIGGAHLNQPIVGIASTPSGQGYWLVATDGGIFSFGDAGFHGSTGAIRLNQPIMAMASTPSGQGYWLVASDGGLFTFGDAFFAGSAGSMPLPAPVVAMNRSQSGHGYWLVLQNGTVLPYGDVPTIGSGTNTLSAPVAGAAGMPSGQGLRLVAMDGSSVALTPGGPAAVATVPTGNSNAFSYLVTNGDGTPARFNPCSAIHYVTNMTAAPAGAAALVSGALARISQASGVSFVDDGATSEVPSSNRQSVQAQYGNRWAPVIVAWAHTGQSDLLPGGNTVGEGGSSWVSEGSGPKIYVTGEVVIDADRTAGLPATFGSGATLGELLLHELGHVIGLGHTNDQNQIMYPTLLPVPSAAYGAGDMSGLGRLGRSAGCLATPAP